MLQNLAITDGLAGSPPKRPLSDQQPPNFIDQTRGEHCVDPAVDPLDKFLPRPSQREYPALIGRSRSLKLLLESGNGLAGFQMDFESPDHTPSVARMQPPSAGGINRGQSLKKGFIPFAVGVTLQFTA